MRILVTGSEGFIGKHVVKALKVAGHGIFSLDLTLGDDITKPIPIIPGLDAVVHLAAMASPRECDTNPALAYNVNVQGTAQVLKMALESGAKKFVFSSSAHVYGVGPRFLPAPEIHPLSLGNTYTTTKILGEELCRLYFQDHGLSYTTLRLFNVYGPGQGPGYFVPDMMEKAGNGTIDLKGGNTSKDWVHVSDVASAFALAVESPFVGEINIGTGIETELVDVASYIVQSYKTAKMVSSYDSNATRMRADITRAASVLGWRPEVKLDDGIKALCSQPSSA